MSGHNVIFDWENGRVGFSESSCTYDKKSVPSAALDHGYSEDCQLSKPVLSQACIDFIDKKLCKYDPTNIAVLGEEKWTALVESAGTDVGRSCVEAAESWVSAKELDAPVIKCNGDGVCEEHRSCQLTCAEAKKAGSVTPAGATESRRLECGDSFWSACDYGCSQSRIESVAFTDGVCHEVSRVSRPCHIGACARSDPCRVPFLVHLVLGFRGAKVERWTTMSEEAFVVALTRAASGNIALNSIFEEGDVNVLAVLPWYLDEDSQISGRKSSVDQNEDLESESSDGLKIVMEISIFNYQAKPKNKTAERQETSRGIQRTSNKLSEMLKNITVSFDPRKEKTVCNMDDLHLLAKKALVLKKEIFGHETFVPNIIHELKKAEADMGATDPSPFQRVYANEFFAAESRVLLSWSIRTEIDDEINYFGPPKPWWFRVLSAINTLVFAVMAVMLLTTVWSLILSCYDACLGPEDKNQNSFLRRRSRYSSVALNDIDTDASTIEDAVMGKGDVELTMQSPGKRYKATTPKKRRSTLGATSSDGSDRDMQYNVNS